MSAGFHSKVKLLGRIQGVRGHSILLAQDLKVNLARADQFEADFVKKVDEFILNNDIDATEETLPALRDGYEVQEVPEMSLTEANIRTVIWATGYSFDFSVVQLPVFDNDGYPIQNRGISDYPGLYFVGLPWLHNAKSGLLFGLAQDAEHVAAAIEEGSWATLDGMGTRTYYISPAEVRFRDVSNELPTSHS